MSGTGTAKTGIRIFTSGKKREKSSSAKPRRRDVKKRGGKGGQSIDKESKLGSACHGALSEIALASAGQVTRKMPGGERQGGRRLQDAG